MAELYPRLEHLLASVQLALAMLGMGALLVPRDFVRVIRTPRALLVGLAVQLLLVPLWASVLGSTLAIPAGIAAGLVLVAAVPGGTMSNVLTYFASGNIALSIALTAVCTLGALFTTPTLLRIFVGAQLPPDFVMPTLRIGLEIGATLLLPLGVGMAIGVRLPHRRDRFARICIRASLAVIGLMVVGAAVTGRLDPRAYGGLTPVAVFALCAGAQLLAFGASWLARLEWRDRLAVAIEATVRNTNLAILVKASLFPAAVGRADPIGDGMFFVALLYGGAALPAVMVPLLWGRARAKELARA